MSRLRYCLIDRSCFLHKICEVQAYLVCGLEKALGSVGYQIHVLDVNFRHHCGNMVFEGIWLEPLYSER